MARGQGQFLLIEDEQAAQNIWARVRLKFDADVDEIARQDALFAPLCDDFAAAHGPTMGVIRDFTDFHMLRLRPRKRCACHRVCTRLSCRGSGVHHYRTSEKHLMASEMMAQLT